MEFSWSSGPSCSLVWGSLGASVETSFLVWLLGPSLVESWSSLVQWLEAEREQRELKQEEMVLQLWEERKEKASESTRWRVKAGLGLA